MLFGSTHLNKIARFQFLKIQSHWKLFIASRSNVFGNFL
ncbi:MAG: DUF3024 domain-containing protein [Planctomycetota bacterium]|nr:MAG: DUF3024 domain-containing protein [Planctomycetota bacterium]